MKKVWACDNIDFRSQNSLNMSPSVSACHVGGQLLVFFHSSTLSLSVGLGLPMTEITDKTAMSIATALVIRDILPNLRKPNLTVGNF